MVASDSNVDGGGIAQISWRNTNSSFLQSVKKMTHSILILCVIKGTKILQQDSELAQ